MDNQSDMHALIISPQHRAPSSIVDASHRASRHLQREHALAQRDRRKSSPQAMSPNGRAPATSHETFSVGQRRQSATSCWPGDGAPFVQAEDRGEGSVTEERVVSGEGGGATRGQLHGERSSQELPSSMHARMAGPNSARLTRASPATRSCLQS